MRRILWAALALAAIVGGCTAISRLPALQPPAVPKPAKVTVPPQAPAAQQPVFQRGVDIDAYTYPGQNIASAALADISYIRSLHANAVSISFPFFMSGPDGLGVYGTPATPTPGQLKVLVSDARSDGLSVSIRPLLDESNLGQSRIHWVPVDKAAWFRSYTRFLRPYAQMAQQAGVQEFITGAEFSAFPHAPGWNSLDRKLRRLFHGTLACATNWSVSGLQRGCGEQVAQTVDAYPPRSTPLLPSWETFDRALPRGTVLTEVGIDAVPGATRAPYVHEWPVTTVMPSVQARWFTAACHAAVAEHLGGVYFWPIGLGTTPAAHPTVGFQGAWGGAGARAISRCFAQIERGSQ